MRNWNNYIKENKFKESDCQLVTACNAYYHLTGNVIDQYEPYYEELKILAGCVAGSCINISKVWKELGICEDKRYIRIQYDEIFKENCFFEMTIWHKYYGFHSIAAVDYNKKCDALRITNFKYETSLKGWIFWEDLKHYLCLNIDGSKPKYNFRTFKLL